MKPMLSVHDYEREALSRLPRAIRGFLRDGTEDNVSLLGSRKSFDAWRLRPRCLRDVEERSSEIELWGTTYSAPFGISPMGVGAIFRRRADLAIATAAHSRRIPYIVSAMSTVPLEDIVKKAPGAWYQTYLPGNPEESPPLLARLEAAGVTTLVITVDAPVTANRENNIRAGFTIPFQLTPQLMLSGVIHPKWLCSVFLKTLAFDGVPRFSNLLAQPGGPIHKPLPKAWMSGKARVSWRHVENIRALWKGKIVLKGILTREDAATAVAHGLDAIIVSDHGGRQLDGVVEPLVALPEIIDAVPSGCPVFLDGGIRRGSDLIKAVSLGAKMVFVGRPAMYGAIVNGRQGVEHIIDILQSEVLRNMGLMGCSSVSELDRSYVCPHTLG